MSNSEDRSIGAKKVFTYLTTAAVICIVIVVLAYTLNFEGPLSGNQNTWGVFGDYIGGVLGPILSFLSLIAVLGALIYQSKELGISTEELRKSSEALTQQSESLKQQNFERTFFELVRLVGDIVKDMDVLKPSLPARVRVAMINSGSAPQEQQPYQGRDCFNFLYKQYKAIYSTRSKGVGESLYRTDIISDSYLEFMNSYQNEVGHYFRTLYRVFKYIDESNVNNKDNYSGIMRAQLSSYELTMLFYNSFHEKGEGFKAYIEEYALLENIDPSLLIVPDVHLHLYDMRAYGDQDLSGCLG